MRAIASVLVLAASVGAAAAADGARPAPPEPPASRAPVRPFESPKPPAPRGRIDELVAARLTELGIRPARLASDAVFLRRAYLDVIGTLPTAQEARRFLLDKKPGKRRRLVDALLERPEFVDYQTMRWCDVLRVKAEFPVNLWPNGAQAYHRWIHDAVRGNLPYDRFARALLTSSGSNFRAPAVNFYRSTQVQEPGALADAVGLAFLGCRTDRWPADRRRGLAAFFSYVGFKSSGEWKEEIVFHDALRAQKDAEAGRLPEGILPDGTRVELDPDRDPREVFADWLIRPDNPSFARCAVNRVWYWLLGRGIVHEPDDMRPDNPPLQAKLLAFLEKDFVRSGYDLKALYRKILLSTTYQLSSIPRSEDPRSEAAFAHYPVRRLDAEVLVDALCQISGLGESYTSAIPEPFTYVPDRTRSIALPDGSISSSVLELFGRPSRDTGLLSERSNRTTAAQRLHFLNSSHVQRKIEQGPRLRALLRGGRPDQLATSIYLTVLSRFPTAEEQEIVREYVASGVAGGRLAAIDLTWALINSSEFLYRH